MKTIICILTLFTIISLSADEAKQPATTEEAKQPATTQTATDATTLELPNINTDETVDEVDLVDDAAIAAKRPKVVGKINEGFESLVDIECDDATLSDILRQFRKTTSANIICDDSTNLQRRVSVSLKRVPWLKGLQSILNSRGFRLEPRDDIFRVIEDRQPVPINTRTFTLNHASAKELAELFNSTYAGKDATGKFHKIANSFEGANVVVVTADDKTLAECDAIIKAVDKAVSQIYIEARFIELSNEALHKLGMQWNSLESWGASLRSVAGGIEYNRGVIPVYRVFDKATREGIAISDGKESKAADKDEYKGLYPEKLVGATGAGRTAEDMSWVRARGFQGQLSFDDFRLALSAFESMNDAKVFSNPKIIVSNGKEAKVDMTTKYPNVTIDSNFTGVNSENQSVSSKLDVIPGEDEHMFAKEAFFSWGITLSVIPRISPDGLITVKIVPTISDLAGYYEVQSKVEIDTPYSRYPIIDVKRLTTEFTMQDGSTAVIGGLSRTKEEDIDSGIPFLRKIPWIGPKLFGWKSREKVQKEILVFVTLGIADPHNLQKDIGLPKNAIMGREYIRGNKLEPGDREGTVSELLKLDMRELDKRENLKPGEVSVNFVQSEVEPKATEN